MKTEIFGKKAIFDAINNEVNIIKIYCEPRDSHLFPIKYQTEKVNSKFFQKFTKELNHQNLMAEIEIDQNFFDLHTILLKAKEETAQTFLIIEEVEDPRNFGAILRSALAFNVDYVFFKNIKQAPINDLVIKTSLGAVHNLKFCLIANISQTIEKLQAAGFWVYCSALTPKSLNLATIKFTPKSVLIVGGENKGVSQLTIRKSDFIIKIPMNKKIQSLNVSVAAGILLNKINEQR